MALRLRPIDIYFLAACCVTRDGHHDPEELSLLKRLPKELGLSPSRCNRILAEALARAPDSPGAREPLDPQELWEHCLELARKDGLVDPDETEALMALIRCLGVPASVLVEWMADLRTGEPEEPDVLDFSLEVGS